jgi:hypothetical protein
LEENKAVHREGVKDPVTLAFMDELSKNNISQKQYSLFDFQFGSKNQDMDLILGAIRGTNSEIMVPGESTSSISESIDVLPAGAVTVYDNSAMNKVHQAHVKSEFEAGRIKLLPIGYKNVLKHEDRQEKVSTQKLSAAEAIAIMLSKQTK